MAVMVLYGEASDLILLKEQEITTARRKDGWDVRCVDGKKDTKNDIEGAFEVGLFDENPVLVVLKTASKVKGLKDLLSTDSLDVLVIQEGDLLKSLMDYPSHEFKHGKGERAIKEACAFLRDEVSKHGRTLSEELALATVKRVGMDFGVLRWEALKLGYCGEGDLTPKEVLGSIASLSESQGTGILDAIGDMSARDFIREMDRLNASKPGDQTMSLCSGLLSSNALVWAETYMRMEKGQSARDIASALRKNPFIMEKVIMPQAKRLGKRRIRELIKITAEAERSVLSGAVNPWLGLKSRILSLMIKA